MNSEFRLHVVKQIADIEIKETYSNPHSLPERKNQYNAQGTFFYIRAGQWERVTYIFRLDDAKDKSEWMMRPLEGEQSLVGLIARKVLTPGYKGYFEVLESETQIRPVVQFSEMSSTNRYPPGYQRMLNEVIDDEEEYINTYLPQRGGIVGRDAIEKKVTGVVDSILRVVSALHEKPHAENEEFFYGCFLDDAITYLMPRVEKANASIAWSVKYGIAVPASDLASSLKEVREAKKALAYYEKSTDAKYQDVVVSSLKAMISNANREDSDAQEPFVRPVQSIQLVGFLHPSEVNSIQSNELSPIPQSDIDWQILEKIFERVNSIWIKKCQDSEFLEFGQ